MTSDEGFRHLVLADARSVKQRQETDSIDIIDEIRYMLVTKILFIGMVKLKYFKKSNCDKNYWEGFYVLKNNSK